MEKKERRKRMTITQVAERAGVTIGTVSHVMNGTAPITQETAQKVYQAIRELNYVPNIMAKSLRSRKNYTIGLMIPNLNNSFHSRITSVFVDRAYKLGYSVQIYGYEYSLEREKEELARLESNNIGVVIIFNGCGDEEEIESFVKKGIPVILADRRTDIPGVPCIEFDNKRVMKEIVLMLKERGYQRIGFFSEPLRLTNLQDRYQGYQDALESCGYPFNENYVFIREDLCLDNLKNGFLYMREILRTRKKEELPQVWITSSDLLAIGIMRAMEESGYKIPMDFGVVGFDNTEISGYVTPRLTTVNQDQVLMGEKLMDMVLRLGNHEQVENILLDQSLIVRKSC